MINGISSEDLYDVQIDKKKDIDRWNTIVCKNIASNNSKIIISKHTDKFIKSASLIYSQIELEEAGLTNIKRCTRLYNDKQNLLATPLHKIFNMLEHVLNSNTQYDLINENIFILVNTGCYDPIHKGHVHIMEEAYNYLTSKGSIVLGGYLIPAHTKYVIKKNKIDSHLKRLDNCQKFVNKHKWLSIDPYEILFEDDDISYTEIIVRLEKYFEIHIKNKYKINIDIGYVFGGDRAKFMRSFVNEGYGICVGRYGYDEIFNSAKNELKSSTNNKNMFWIDRQLEFAEISSTLIRNMILSETHTEIVNSVYYIQNRNFDADDTQYYCNQLLDIIRGVFANNKNISVKIMNQYSQNNNLIKNKKYKTISIDPFVKSDYYINISSLFGYGDTKSFIKIIKQPYFIPLDKQIKIIPSGTYELINNSFATDTMMIFAERLLTANALIKIKVKTLLTNYYEDKNIYNIVDCADFLIGSHLGGLVVEIPSGEHVRVPYILPYVFPSDQAKIPIEQNISFSKNIWTLNLKYYSKNNKLVKEIDLSTRIFLNYIGFVDDCSMKYVCTWHLIFFN